MKRGLRGGALVLGLLALPLLALVVALVLALPGCVPAPTMGTGAFHEAEAATRKLVRGVSTKDDVEHLLGAPNGEGAARFWNEAAPRAVWYYEDDRASGTELRPDGVHTNYRQQILFIFFKGKAFDGYLWSDVSAPAQGH